MSLPYLTVPSDGGLSQANCIVSHPTMPLLITAHEDKYISIYDINTGQFYHAQVVLSTLNSSQANAPTRCLPTWTA
jgi:WD40 repeat protein